MLLFSCVSARSLCHKQVLRRQFFPPLIWYAKTQRNLAHQDRSFDRQRTTLRCGWGESTSFALKNCSQEQSRPASAALLVLRDGQTMVSYACVPSAPLPPVRCRAGAWSLVLARQKFVMSHRSGRQVVYYYLRKYLQKSFFAVNQKSN